ncbi:Protein tamozhennic [Trichinella papuae]|uniref:Protein tamozhennic n=1 Tax=Trichinella papuae TaxID=268474 RepID=A0A0V1MJ24_9BILA|nr:Protein tamozhennic [Trichinella papuae]
MHAMHDQSMQRSVIASQYEELLGTENTPQVYQVLNELIRCSADFLCSVEQKEKFRNLTITRILCLSASECAGFNGFSAATCFDQLERMCKNLLLYQWRREEYRFIRKCTPFFHNLRNTLSDCESLFYLMGYRGCEQDDDNENRLELKAKIPSRDLIGFAFDCFLANIECQLLQTMYSWLEKRKISPKWIDLVQCRCNTVGSVELCCGRILHRSRPSANLVEHDLDRLLENLTLPTTIDASQQQQCCFESNNSNNFKKKIIQPNRHPSIVQSPMYKRYTTDEQLVAQRGYPSAACSSSTEKRVPVVETKFRSLNMAKLQNCCPKCGMVKKQHAIICPYCDFLFS